MQDMCTTIKIYMAICLCEFIAASDTSIKWDVKTKSVIYGQETSLTCNGQTCSPHSSKQWIGGPSYELLSSEDYTANLKKYEMVVQSTSSYFDLIIKNFTFDDANCKYTCVCGLHQYTKMLELDSLEFIYPPYLEKCDIVTKDSKVQVDLLMQVFPLPTCMISYQESVMPLNISDYTTTYKHGDHFKLYEVRIHQIYEMDHLSCKGSFNLSCTVGSRNYTPKEMTIHFCTEVQNNHMGIVGVVVFGIVVCLCSLGIPLFVMRRNAMNLLQYRPHRHRLPGNETSSLFQVDDNG